MAVLTGFLKNLKQWPRMDIGYGKPVCIDYIRLVECCGLVLSCFALTLKGFIG